MKLFVKACLFFISSLLLIACEETSDNDNIQSGSAVDYQMVLIRDDGFLEANGLISLDSNDLSGSATFELGNTLRLTGSSDNGIQFQSNDASLSASGTLNESLGEIQGTYTHNSNQGTFIAIETNRANSQFDGTYNVEFTIEGEGVATLNGVEVVDGFFFIQEKVDTLNRSFFLLGFVSLGGNLVIISTGEVILNQVILTEDTQGNPTIDITTNVDDDEAGSALDVLVISNATVTTEGVVQGAFRAEVGSSIKLTGEVNGVRTGTF